MKLKNDEELCNVLSMGFAGYSNRVQNGHGLDPYKPFLNGETVVTVQVFLNDDGSIAIKNLPETIVKEPEPTVTEKPSPTTEPSEPYPTEKTSRIRRRGTDQT